MALLHSGAAVAESSLLAHPLADEESSYSKTELGKELDDEVQFQGFTIAAAKACSAFAVINA